MSEKNKRAEELLFGKERMTFTEIMQSMEACAKINCEKCALHAIIDGWSQADLPDCSTVLMKNASDTLLEYYNKLRTPEPAVNAKAEERHEECSSKVEGYLDSCPVCPNKVFLRRTNYGRLSGKSQCRRTLSIWTLIAERMGGTSARALSGQKETREG